jgi:hypothetical protein
MELNMTTLDTMGLTPADFGIIAATLGDCRGLGDDDATDALRDSLFVEAGFDLDEAETIAYAIVHRHKRHI